MRHGGSAGGGSAIHRERIGLLCLKDVARRDTAQCPIEDGLRAVDRIAVDAQLAVVN